MSSLRFVLAFTASFLIVAVAQSAGAAGLRPPAVPLVTCDPYFSIWSPADKLTDADTVHWTGKPHRLTAAIDIDGGTYRVMGRAPAAVAPMPQTNLTVLPTQTVYKFAAAGVELTLTFLTPALSDDLDILSRPVTYLLWEVASTDGAAHNVKLVFTASGELAVNTPDQVVDAVDRRAAGAHSREDRFYRPADSRQTRR